MKKSDLLLTIMSVIASISCIILLAEMVIECGWSILYDINPYIDINLWLRILDICMLTTLGLLMIGIILYVIVVNKEIHKEDSED